MKFLFFSKTLLIDYFFCILLSFLFDSTVHQSAQSKEFTLIGEIANVDDTEFVVLSYFDDHRELVNDTLKLYEGKFKANGRVLGATMCSLSKNAVPGQREDAEAIFFFLENSTIFIKIEESFNNAKIEGSETQNDHRKLETATNVIYKKLDPLIIRRNKLLKEEKNGSIDKEENRIIDSISNIQTQELKKIKDIRLKFVKDNGSSYLSAYWLNFYFGEMPLDRVDTYFKRLSPTVQRSINGIELADKITITKNAVPSRVGNKAYNFRLEDTNSNLRNLDDFKGKYVLLDFWASWCGPCLEAFPKMKRLFNLYHSRGLEIVGISSDSDKESWLRAIEREDLDDWLHVFAGEDNLFNTVNYNIKAIPAYILVNKEGKIIGRYLIESEEYKTFQDLENELKEIFETYL